MFKMKKRLTKKCMLKKNRKCISSPFFRNKHRKRQLLSRFSSTVVSPSGTENGERERSKYLVARKRGLWKRGLQPQLPLDKFETKEENAFKGVTVNPKQEADFLKTRTEKRVISWAFHLDSKQHSFEGRKRTRTECRRWIEVPHMRVLGGRLCWRRPALRVVIWLRRPYSVTRRRCDRVTIPITSIRLSWFLWNSCFRRTSKQMSN